MENATSARRALVGDHGTLSRGAGYVGTYSAGTAITLTSSDPATTIRYTVNGADPTSSDTAIASGGNIYLMTSFTVRARNFKTGCDPSDVVTVAYTATGSLGAGTVGAGNNHSFARNTSGSVWGWGLNGNGQLGDATTTSPRTSWRSPRSAR